MNKTNKNLYIEVGNRLDENNVFLSIKWTPTSGVLRPDGRRLRGKFKVSKIRKTEEGKVLVILNNGMVLKIDPTIPVEKQGFKFRLQHTEPMTLKQAYEYINDIKDLPVKTLLGYIPPKNESVYFDKVAPGNIIKEFKFNKDNYLEISLKNKDKILLDPDLELKNQIFNFYNQNSNPINIFEAVVLHYGIEFNETMHGYEIDRSSIQESILNESGITDWIKKVSGKGVSFFKNLKSKGLGGVLAQQAGEKMLVDTSKSIYYDWLRFSGKTRLPASPKNLMLFLKNSKFNPALIKLVSEETKRVYGEKFPIDQIDTEKAPTVEPNREKIEKEIQEKIQKYINDLYDIITEKITRESITNILNIESEEDKKKKIEEIKNYANELNKTKKELEKFVSENKENIPEAAISGIEEFIRSTTHNIDVFNKEFKLNLINEHIILERKKLLEAIKELKDNAVKNFFVLVVQTAIANDIKLPNMYRHLMGDTYEGIYGSDQEETSSADEEEVKVSSPRKSSDNSVIYYARDNFRINPNKLKDLSKNIKYVHSENKLDMSKKEIEDLAKLGAAYLKQKGLSSF